MDLSNTQYALFGLNAAARCGVSVPLDLLQRTLEYVIREQEKDGMPSELFIENPAWEPAKGITSSTDRTTGVVSTACQEGSLRQ